MRASLNGLGGHNPANKKGGMAMVKQYRDYADMVSEARRRALQSGIFTDNPEEYAKNPGQMYLVSNIDLVIKAFLKDIEEGDVAEYKDPADFLDKHGIEWE